MNLYKYRPINKWTLEGLRNKTLHFSNPSDYNDPFDYPPRSVSHRAKH